MHKHISLSCTFPVPCHHPRSVNCCHPPRSLIVVASRCIDHDKIPTSLIDLCRQTLEC
ncbi:hypothetical protein N665_0115s0028 [Sinapis alba]|nr:hypothetical protein N665_0115s0028 [Sinapis alba]